MPQTKASSKTDTSSGEKGQAFAGAFDSKMWENCTKNFQKIPENMDFDLLISSHRKNMETIRQAQQTASELLQNLVNLNNQYIRSSFDDLGSQVRTFTADGKDVKSKTNDSADSMKTSFDRSIAHCKQVTDLFSQSTAKVFDSYRKRFEEGLSEAQSFFKKASA